MFRRYCLTRAISRNMIGPWYTPLSRGLRSRTMIWGNPKNGQEKSANWLPIFLSIVSGKGKIRSKSDPKGPKGPERASAQPLLAERDARTRRETTPADLPAESAERTHHPGQVVL